MARGLFEAEKRTLVKEKKSQRIAIGTGVWLVFLRHDHLGNCDALALFVSFASSLRRDRKSGRLFVVAIWQQLYRPTDAACCAILESLLSTESLH